MEECGYIKVSILVSKAQVRMVVKTSKELIRTWCGG